MALRITGLTEWRERLANVRAEEVLARALADNAERLAEAVRDGLSAQPGGAHDRPWTRTGALRDSIGAQTDGLNAVVGSSDKAAAPQEMGTATIPPRPFLAPLAAAQGEAIAKSIGDAVSQALRGSSVDSSDQS